MRNARRAAGALLDAVGLAMLVAGPVMVIRAAAGRREIRSELAAQHITFPEDEHRLPTGLAGYAGHHVETGPEARAYAQVIKSNVAEITSGRSYSEVSAELHAADGEDEKLAELRQAAFMGETLRASLMSAYQAWELTTLVTGLGALFTGLGVALLASQGGGARCVAAAETPCRCRG